jgi:hypothetical protein
LVVCLVTARIAGLLAVRGRGAGLVRVGPGYARKGPQRPFPLISVE